MLYALTKYCKIAGRRWQGKMFPACSSDLVPFCYMMRRVNHFYFFFRQDSSQRLWRACWQYVWPWELPLLFSQVKAFHPLFCIQWTIWPNGGSHSFFSSKEQSLEGSSLPSDDSSSPHPVCSRTRCSLTFPRVSTGMRMFYAMHWNYLEVGLSSLQEDPRSFVYLENCRSGNAIWFSSCF